MWGIGQEGKTERMKREKNKRRRVGKYAETFQEPSKTNA